MPFKPEEAFIEMSRGNTLALEFLRAFYLWVHKQDDLIDRDHPVAVENSVGFDLQVLRAFGSNPWFHQHQADIWPVLVTSALAYIASEDRRQSADALERIEAQVLKSQYVDVFLTVAFICGGWDHAVAMGRKYREFNYDVEPVKVADLALAKSPEIE